MVGYEGVNLFPGLILIFVARVIRTRVARRAPPELDEAAGMEDSRPERVLNTERVSRTPEPPPPDPVVRYQRAGAQTTVDDDDDEGEFERGERDHLIERIAHAGRETATGKETAADRSSSGPTLESERLAGEHRKKPMTSAEMLAQAHKRWDRKR